MPQASPTIKGIFVNSHVGAVRREKGDAGVGALERLYGKPLAFRNSQDVPIREEIRIIEAALDILTDHGVPSDRRGFEAGRLHFRNFSTTPLARIIFSVFRKNFKLMMLQSKNIAGHVFQGVRFTSTDLGPTEVRVRMEHADYPIDHFRGLFFEWMVFSGYEGSVEGIEVAPGVYEYTAKWTGAE